MKYRAKITSIEAWVKDLYSVNAFNYVKDKKEVYIEVANEDEAELLESINKSEKTTIELKHKWLETHYLT